MVIRYHGTIETDLTSAGYAANYSFDANGNITALKRWSEDMSGTTVFMDDLTYKYDDPINGGFNNRLTSVDDIQGQMMDCTLFFIPQQNCSNIGHSN
ncbi:MAG: hypothetical protein WED10_00135 [Brumimicrobium sp.]